MKPQLILQITYTVTSSSYPPTQPVTINNVVIDGIYAVACEQDNKSFTGATVLFKASGCTSENNIVIYIIKATTTTIKITYPNGWFPPSVVIRLL